MLETETVLDRRRLRRSLSFWRAAGIAAVALALGLALFGGDKLTALTGEKQIARIAIEGTITEDRDQLKMLKDIAEAEHVSGVILFVNSPGGTTTGGEALYEGLRAIAKKKPVVAQFGTVAASAGLYRRARHRPHRGAWQHHHRLGRRHRAMAGVRRAARQARRQGERDKERAAQGRSRRRSRRSTRTAGRPPRHGRRRVQVVPRAGRERRGINAPAVAGLEQGRVFSGREALS